MNDYTDNKIEGLKQLLIILWQIIKPVRIKRKYVTVEVPEGFEETRPEVIKINENKVIVVINCYKK